MVRRARLRGDVYRPNAKVLKLKGETPSVLEIAGNRYILDSRAGQTIPGIAGNNMRIVPDMQQL